MTISHFLFVISLIMVLRAAVDQTFYRLVNLGIIIRVARGLYIKATSKLPDVGEIAQAKAAAFHKIHSATWTKWQLIH